MPSTLINIHLVMANSCRRQSHNLLGKQLEFGGLSVFPMAQQALFPCSVAPCHKKLSVSRPGPDATRIVVSDS